MAFVSSTDFDALIEANAQALATIAGVLAEAVGAAPTAYALAAAFEADRKIRPSLLRERLLRQALQLVVLKARNRHPDDPVVQDLVSRLLPDQTKQ